jgi:hypothetical protein
MQPVQYSKFYWRLHTHTNNKVLKQPGLPNLLLFASNYCCTKFHHYARLMPLSSHQAYRLLINDAQPAAT